MRIICENNLFIHEKSVTKRPLIIKTYLLNTSVMASIILLQLRLFALHLIQIYPS